MGRRVAASQFARSSVKPADARPGSGCSLRFRLLSLPFLIGSLQFGPRPAMAKEADAIVENTARRPPQRRRGRRKLVPPLLSPPERPSSPTGWGHGIPSLASLASVPFHSAILSGPPATLGAVLWTLKCLPVEMPASGVISLLYGTYFGALGVSVVAYRLGPWHPLAGFPGPVAFRTSKLWMATCAAAGRECFVVKGLHEQYGDVVRTWTLEFQGSDGGTLSKLNIVSAIMFF